MTHFCKFTADYVSKESLRIGDEQKCVVFFLTHGVGPYITSFVCKNSQFVVYATLDYCRILDAVEVR